MQLRGSKAGPGRLIGIDLARTVALVGMIATHTLDQRTASGDLTTVQWLAGGRSAALFAVLAGVSIALMSGGPNPVQGRARTRTVLGLAARAVLVALIGFGLGGLSSGLAIILSYYGVLFLLSLPFIGLRAVSLAVLAAVWAVVAPIVSHLLRPELPDRHLRSPEFAQLTDPGPLLSDLLFTGFYPAVPWLAYLLAGMAIGRMTLSGWRKPLSLAGGGLALAVLATVVSRLSTAPDGGRTPLLPNQQVTDEQLALILSYSQYGVTPTDGAWQWLLVVSPHSATPFDLAQTIGSALVVIGLALALAAVLPRWGRSGLAVLAGAGAMPLTLYSLHVVMRRPALLPPDMDGVFAWNLVVVLGIGGVFALLRRRGPLEWIVGWPGRRLKISDEPAGVTAASATQ